MPTSVDRPSVFVTRKLPEPVETRMMELFDADLSDEDAPLSRAQLMEAMATADVLAPTVTDRIDAEIISAAGPRLKLIANYGAGVDHIDLEAAHAKGLIVTNTPGVLNEDTADMAMGLILAVARRIGEGQRLVRAQNWDGWRPTGLMGTTLRGKRLGIVGMGRIGASLARRARAFGMAVHYHNRRRAHEDIEKELEATYWESLNQMVARMDVISLNCPRTPATYHLLNAPRLQMAKQGAIVINTSRGDVIDEAALVRGLASGRIGGAGLDVYEHEPVVTPKLLKMENVVLTPHIASATVEARIAMGEKVIANIKAFTDGHPPPDRVLTSMF
jgi:glyoxylate reductase